MYVRRESRADERTNGRTDGRGPGVISPGHRGIVSRLWENQKDRGTQARDSISPTDEIISRHAREDNVRPKLLSLVPENAQVARIRSHRTHPPRQRAKCGSGEKGKHAFSDRIVERAPGRDAYRATIAVLTVSSDIFIIYLIVMIRSREVFSTATQMVSGFRV